MWKLLYMFRVVLPSIIRSAYNCIYRIWYLSHRYCYLPLSWKSWNGFECAVGGVRHPQHTQTGLHPATTEYTHQHNRLICRHTIDCVTIDVHKKPYIYSFS
jgi:hypothetical protein